MPSSIASIAATIISAPRPARDRRTATGRAISRARASQSGPFGGTPNSITRYLLAKWKLDPKSDVTLVETSNSATIAAVRSEQAQIGDATEPFMTQGIRNSVWDEPFFNVPKELGPYAYSTINVRLDSIQKEPEIVRSLRARHGEGAQVRLCQPGRDRARSPRSSFPPWRSTTCGRRSTVRSPTRCGAKDGIITRAILGYGKVGRARGRHLEGRRQAMTRSSTCALSKARKGGRSYRRHNRHSGAP